MSLHNSREQNLRQRPRRHSLAQDDVQPNEAPYHFDDFIPSMVSGELFLRSTPQLFDWDQDDHLAGCSAPTTHHPSGGLLTNISTDLQNLLLGSTDASFQPEDEGNSILLRARREQRSVRLERVRYLEALKRTMACMVAAKLSAVGKSTSRYRGRCRECRARLETKLSSLMLRYASTIDVSFAEEDSRKTAESKHCKREQERLELVARLASLAATAEHRTRGSVVLRRLPSTHPQHSRCLRAATDNVKTGFFTPNSPYGAVRVLDVYKIENRLQVEKFQRAVAATESRKVKGLFCHVPIDSIEHVVMFGMGESSEGSSGGAENGGHTQWEEWTGSLPLDPLWQCIRLARSGDRTEASKGKSNEKPWIIRPRPYKSLQFPRPFSRHSTLEEERYRGNCRSSEGTQGCLRGTSKNPVTGSAVMGGREKGALSELRMLALCRVIISNMSVSSAPLLDVVRRERLHRSGDSADSSQSKPGRAPSSAAFCPPAPGQVDNDAVYFPHEDEFLLLRENLVLPEFLLLHRFAHGESTRSSVSTPEAKDGASVTALISAGVSGVDDAMLASAPESSWPAESAASVVAGIMAAMGRHAVDGEPVAVLVPKRETTNFSSDLVPPDCSGDYGSQSSDKKMGVYSVEPRSERGRENDRSQREAFTWAIHSSYGFLLGRSRPTTLFGAREFLANIDSLAFRTLPAKLTLRFWPEPEEVTRLREGNECEIRALAASSARRSSSKTWQAD